jgi:hypothetical protein
MLGLEYAKQTNTKLSYSGKGDTDLNCWNRSLGVSITKYCSRMLIMPMLKSVSYCIHSHKVKPILYTPHLSKHLYSPNQLLLLHIVSKLGLIFYYDDGMTLVSGSGILWEDNLLPIEQRELIGWNHAFRGRSSPELSISIASSYSSLVKSFAVSTFSHHSQNHVPCNYCCLPKRKLIIASKWLDWDALDRLNPRSNPTEYCYVKHYRQSKNNLLYEKLIANWDPVPNLELSLPSNISSFSHCYFGVTSTILFVLDVLLLLDSPSIIETIFVPLINVSSCDYAGEAADFIKALRSYSGRLKVNLPG